MTGTRYIVYQITDDIMFYIGSSSMTLARRKAGHHDIYIKMIKYNGNWFEMVKSHDHTALGFKN